MFWSEPPVGYRGFIAIHNMALGPVMGGTRFWDYQTRAGSARQCSPIGPSHDLQGFRRRSGCGGWEVRSS